MEQTILNLLPITKGGGLQNVMSFLKSLSEDAERRDQVTVICREGTAAADFTRDNFSNSRLVPRGLKGRIQGELHALHQLTHAKLCFTFFGSPTIGSRGKFVNVCGNAYPNLFYPEVDFWAYLPMGGRIKCKAIDIIRRKGQKLADFWIFETDVMRGRAMRLFNFPSDRCAVVKMAPSDYVRKDRVNPTKFANFDKAIRPGFRMLMLAGAHSNKKQIYIPEWIDALKKLGCEDFAFVTTMNEQAPYAQEVIQEVKRRGQERHYTNIGPVQPQDCASLIEACSAMLCVSRLESFSNNFVEAWNMEKPLVASDWDWSQDAGGRAALYVKPDQFSETAATLKTLMTSQNQRDDLVKAGRENLKSYHTPASKYVEQWRVIEHARGLGFCPPETRRKIRW